MTYDRFKLFHLLEDGQSKLAQDAKDHEESKAGVWRGGTSGCITTDGRVLGADPTDAILRFLGIQKDDADFSKALMFQAGHSNEEGLADWLAASGTVFLQESDCPMTETFEHPAGPQTITGRPDFILTEGDRYQHGIELKLSCSFHSLMKTAHFIDGKPKTDHVIQAANYSRHFNIPWTLMYINRVNWPVPYGNPTKSNPAGRWSWPDHPALRKDETDRVYTILPYVSPYDLTWEEDKLLINEQPTLITGTGIVNFYKYCADCIHEKRVPTLRSGYWEWNGSDVPNEKNDTLRYGWQGLDTSSWESWVASAKEQMK